MKLSYSKRVSFHDLDIQQHDSSELSDEVMVASQLPQLQGHHHSKLVMKLSLFNVYVIFDFLIFQIACRCKFFQVKNFLMKTRFVFDIFSR